MSAMVGCGKVSQNQSDAGSAGGGGDAGDDAGGLDASLVGDATVVTEAALVGGMVGATVAASTWCRTTRTAACWRLRRPTPGAVRRSRYSPADR
jgi:hypothetical protein